MEDSSTSDDRSSPHSSARSDSPLLDIFTLTRDDVEALREYVDEFQEANAERRSAIIQNAMADIMEVRHGDRFNKVDASKVRFIFHVMPSGILIFHHRKYGNGIIIIMLDLSDSMSSSSDDGPHATRIIICVEMRL